MNHLKLDIPFKRFEDCILVKGANRSIVMDLTRNKSHLIPNDLNEILVKYDGVPILDILQIYGSENEAIIKDYFNFLLSEEIIFFTSEPQRFPEISRKHFEEPSIIYQAIIDVKENFDALDLNFKSEKENIVSSLNFFNCKYLQFRFYDNFNLTNFQTWLERFQDSTLIGIDIVIPYDDSLAIKDSLIYLNRYPKVNSVLIYRSPRSSFISYNSENYGFSVQFIESNISGCINCGVVSTKYFSTNIKLAMQSHNFNSCLYKKISIDADGQIKNCPSLKESFGSIYSSHTLQNALSSPEFKKYWEVKKDEILVCKDCEFRHMCTDCRAYVENPDDKYSKPLKCGYSPYSNVWEDWSINPLKQYAISLYQMESTINR